MFKVFVLIALCLCLGPVWADQFIVVDGTAKEAPLFTEFEEGSVVKLGTGEKAVLGSMTSGARCTLTGPGEFKLGAGGWIAKGKAAPPALVKARKSAKGQVLKPVSGTIGGTFLRKSDTYRLLTFGGQTQSRVPLAWTGGEEVEDEFFFVVRVLVEGTATEVWQSKTKSLKLTTPPLEPGVYQVTLKAEPEFGPDSESIAVSTIAVLSAEDRELYREFTALLERSDASAADLATATLFLRAHMFIEDALRATKRLQALRPGEAVDGLLQELTKLQLGS